MSGPKGEQVVPVRFLSQRHRQIEVESHGGESRDEEKILRRLQIRGLGHANRLQANALSFAMSGLSALDPLASAATISDPSTAESIDVAKLWYYDPNRNAFIIPRKKVIELMNRLSNEEVTLTLGVATKSTKNAEVFNIPLSKDSAEVRVVADDHTKRVDASTAKIYPLVGVSLLGSG